ncbi:MAG TPA: hypothetical protein VHD36_11225 [Pirellulales bacterium]|nr:hypothetical protein [Pirellulales bacterium]
MSSESSNLPPLGATELPRLGSLAQAVRDKSLRQARNMLIIIGVITVAVNLFAAIEIRDRIQKEAAGLQAKGQLIDHDKLEALIRAGQVSLGAFVVLGIIFLLLGLTVRTYPVPITITAFVLYVAANVIVAISDPSVLASGFIFKIIVVAALVKAIQAALAYQREEAASLGGAAA